VVKRKLYQPFGVAKYRVVEPQTQVL